MASTVTAPMAGKILRIEAAPGQQVQEDDVILVMEAMKMEIPVVAPESGTVREIRVTPNQMVEADDAVAILE